MTWRAKNWHWIGLTLGVLAGLADYGVFLVMGSEALTAPDPRVFAVALAAIFGAFGFAVGRLALARQRAARDADTIEQQLRDLEDAQKTLLEQEKLAAVGRLAAGVAHEVRNPLGVIRASAALVKESFSPGEDQHRACGFICEEIDRLNSLITALLTFSRPTEPSWQEVSIEKVLDRSLHLAGEALSRNGLRVQREPAGEASVIVRADPDLLAQVVLDLLINAAEAVDENGRIALRTSTDDERLLIDVADDGPGVPPAIAGEIFEPFVTTKAKGTGLGLAMAKRIIETHDGTLHLEPNSGAGADGRGACFRIAIPLYGAAAALHTAGPAA